jgi:hypothetical protein
LKRWPGGRLATILAHHERTEAVILSEGIETVQHLEQALQ